MVFPNINNGYQVQLKLKKFKQRLKTVQKYKILIFVFILSFFKVNSLHYDFDNNYQKLKT